MNSQIISLDQALRSYKTFYLVLTLLTISLFLPAGFVSVFSIWLFVLCLYSALGRFKWRDLTFENPLLWLPLLFLLNAFWILFSTDRDLTIDLVLRKVHLFLIPVGFLVVDKKLSERAFHFILTLFLAGCVVSSFICLASALASVVFHDISWASIRYYFDNSRITEPVNIPAVYLTMFCNLALLIALRNPFLGRPGKLMVALYLGLFIVVTGSLPGLICLSVIVFLGLQLTRYRQMSRIIFAILIIGSLVVVVANGSWVNIQYDMQETKGEIVKSIPARMEIWSHAVATAKKGPLLGYGAGLGQGALNETYDNEGFLWGIRESLNPHNQFLSTYLDLGIPGFCIVIASLIHAFVLSVRQNDPYLLGFLILIILFFSFESVLVRQKGIVFFSLFYSMLGVRLPDSGSTS